MSNPKHIKRFWMWVGIALLVELAAFTLWKRWYWFFPTHAVSEVYTRYAGTDGLNVVFFKDYRVNDSVFVDVTLIEAKDSCSWEMLCEDFEIAPLSMYPKEYIELMSLEHSFDQRIVSDTVVSGYDSVCVKSLIVFSHLNKTMCIFQNIDDLQYDAILNKKNKEITF